MTEEKSVTFTAREIADALEYWAWRTRAITIPGDARLNLTSHTINGPASATLTWASMDSSPEKVLSYLTRKYGGGGMRK